MPEAYERAVVADVLDGLALPKKLIHILVGPRQVGKSTAADQVGSRWRGKVVKAVADQPLPPGPEWIQGHWDHARSFSAQGTPTLLILDEVQMVRGWSESVKAQWDDCVSRDLPLHVIVLGSSSLLVQEGSNESLAGRFLHYKINH